MKRLMLIGLAAFAGCTTKLGTFTVYSPKTIDLSKAEYRVDKTQKVSGVDASTLYLVFPSPEAPQYDRAVRNAMAKKPGCVGLADVTLTRKAFWLVFGYCDFVAEGYPIVKKEVK